MNDNELIVGAIENEYVEDGDYPTSAVWKEGAVIEIAHLLGVDTVKNLAPLFSDTYLIEAIKKIKSVNNKGQMTCTGIIWGKWYPSYFGTISKLGQS